MNKIDKTDFDSIREDIVRKNVFVSWTNEDKAVKDKIVDCLKKCYKFTVCESDSDCAGDFLQWSIEAAKKSGVFLLILTKNLLEKKKSLVLEEIKAWKACFENTSDYVNRTVVVCTDLKLLDEFKDENGELLLCDGKRISCEKYSQITGLTAENLANILNKVAKLIVNRMSKIYAEKVASGRSIDITRILGVDLQDTENSRADFDKIYIPREVEYKEKRYKSAVKLIRASGKDVLFITAKAGVGKSCYIGQIIREYNAVDGALILTATCREAANFCKKNKDDNSKYPVLLRYLFREFIKNCGIGESFYTIDNFASLIVDKFESGKDVVVVLDALDEIALLDNTREFAGRIEEFRIFCEDKVNIVITDRGESSTNLFENVSVSELKEFNDENIDCYCEKLFALLGKRELTNQDIKKNISELKYKVNCLDDDIKYNPFILTQVILVYAFTGEIKFSDTEAFDDITDIMFKCERLKFVGEKKTVTEIVKLLAEFAYCRHNRIAEGKEVTRKNAVNFFKNLFQKSFNFGELKAIDEGCNLTDYIESRAFYSFVNNKFCHESYGEYLTARYFCDKVFDEDGNIVNQEKLDELLSHCGDEYWKLVINMFIRRSGVKSIVIPESTINVGNFVFSGCSLLESVTIQKGVISIREHAFNGCCSLKNIILLKGLKSIGSRAFNECNALESITMPDTLTDIGEYAFNKCRSLKSLNIPKGVIRIGKNAFRGCCSLKNITISEGVKNISEFAFSRCASLENIKMPDTLVDIGLGAFYKCRSLKNVTLPKGVADIGDSAFAKCSSLESITIPDTLVNIGSGAFYKCRSLKNVTLPKGVADIGDSTFAKCSSLESITIPDTLIYIGEEVFLGCGSLKRVVIPNGVACFQEYMFYGCASLESIIAPDSLIKIKESAFEGCHSLKKVTIPKWVISIGEYVFCGCSSLENIIIPDALRIIGESAFEGCHSLKKAYFAEKKGWRAGGTEIPPCDLSDPEKAAYLLKEKYSLFCWEREDISRSNVFISWTGADEKIKSAISRYLNENKLTVCESDTECSGNFMQWSVEAAVKSGVFLLILTKNLVENEKSVARQEIEAWKKYFNGSDDYANRTVVVCSDLKLIERFKDEKGIPYISNTDCMSCEVFSERIGFQSDNLKNIHNKITKLIVNRMSKIYAEKVASGRSIDITRILGVDLQDTENSRADFDKIYIPREVEYKEKRYKSAVKLIRASGKDVLFITAKAGVGKSCYIGQIIREYNAVDGALILTATCREAANFCKKNKDDNSKYPVLLRYLFREFIKNCGIGESFYTIDNFASLIVDKFESGKDVVVVIDALDEIALLDNTREFVGRIEEFRSFCEDKVNIVITDRGESSTNLFKNFSVSELKEFNDENIDCYCEKLFGLLGKNCIANIVPDLDMEDLKDKIKGLKEDIKRNPFMLTQVVSLYAVTGKISNSVIDTFDAVTDVMFKSERLKFMSQDRKLMPSGIIEMLSEFAYLRQIQLSNGQDIQRSQATKLFGRLLNEMGGLSKFAITGEELTEYIVFRALYSFKESKFCHESYGEYLTARYFCDKVFDDYGNIANQEKLDELLSHCGDEYWKLVINMFVRRSGIQKITIQDDVTSICDFLFRECSSLKNITLPNGIKSIEKFTFYKCESLQNIIIPQGVTSIGEYAFSECGSLRTIIIPASVNNIDTGAFFRCYSLQSVTIPSSVASIGQVAFHGCRSLREIEIPDSVTLISDLLFSECVSLQSVMLPDKLIRIGEFSFCKCASLQNIKLPDSVREIGECAFAGCSSLKSATVPKGVMSIGKNAFDSCSSLRSITILEGVREISNGAFNACVALQNVSLPEGLTRIGGYAFSDCSSLQRIIIPESTKSISEGAFYKCDSLKYAYFKNTHGWQARFNDIDSDDLSDPAIAAYLLMEKYSEYTWWID